MPDPTCVACSIARPVQKASVGLLSRIALPERADLLASAVPAHGALARRLERMPDALVYERK